MQGVKEGLNRMLNLIREEIEDATASAWRALEAERDQLQTLHANTRAELQRCKGQLASQGELLKAAREETTNWQRELAQSAEAYRQPAEENARLASELAKSKADVESLGASHQEFQAQVVRSQGKFLQAFLYKLTQSSAFGEFVNECGDVINPLATTDAIELITLDHPKIDVKKPEYGYDDKDIRDQVNWRLVESILKAGEFSLLTNLQGVNHILSVEEVLESTVDEDLMFQELDATGITSPLEPPIRKILPVLSSIPQQDLEE